MSGLSLILMSRREPSYDENLHINFFHLHIIYVEVNNEKYVELNKMKNSLLIKILNVLK